MSDDLVSVRGLVDSDFDMPVREFDGVFDGYETAPAQGYDGTRVMLNYRDIDNVVAVSPYNLPTVVLNIGLSNKKKSRWGYYGDSLADLLAPDEDIKDSAGKTHHVVFCDGQDGRPAPKPIWSRDANTKWKAFTALEQKINAMMEAKESPADIGVIQEELDSIEDVHRDGMVPTPVWVVTSVDGVGAGDSGGDSGQSAAERAEEHIIGVNRADFNKWFFADPVCRKDVALTRAISDKSFVNSLVQMGRIEEDENGIFKVPVAAG